MPKETRSLDERRFNSVFLSPHCDDVAFSLGSFVSGNPDGTLVNLFTRSVYTAGFEAAGTPHPEDIERISAARRAEDEAFCKMAALNRLDLGLEEPFLRGRRTRDLTGVSDDIQQLERPLVELLQRLFAEAPGPLRLYCPAGIGGHVNHHAARAVVIKNMEWIEQHASVMFYEDLHYASRYAARFAGLAGLRWAMRNRRGARLVWKVGDPAAKLAMINAYPSQHTRPVISLSPAFTPKTVWPFGAHEAVWSFPPSPKPEGY